MKPKASALKIVKPLGRLRKERTQITNIRNERGDITTDPTDTKKIRTTMKLYIHKFDILKKMDQFPERNHPPKLTQEETI